MCFDALLRDPTVQIGVLNLFFEPRKSCAIKGDSGYLVNSRNQFFYLVHSVFDFIKDGNRIPNLRVRLISSGTFMTYACVASKISQNTAYCTIIWTPLSIPSRSFTSPSHLTVLHNNRQLQLQIKTPCHNKISWTFQSVNGN